MPETDTDTKAGLPTTLFGVDAPVSGFAPPFPDVLNTIGSGFASSAGDTAGNFGVGVNANFGVSSRPEPHRMLASGAVTQEFLNDTDEVESFDATIFIPAPVITLADQIGDFFPPGPDSVLDETAVFAAIGDPFDITSAGGSFAFTQGDGVVLPPSTPSAFGHPAARRPAFARGWACRAGLRASQAIIKRRSTLVDGQGDSLRLTLTASRGRVCNPTSPEHACLRRPPSSVAAFPVCSCVVT